MIELKCPFCQQELRQDYTGVMYCCNEKCKKSADWYGSWVLWQELISTRKDLSDKIGKLETELERTRKELDVAVDALDRMAIHDSIYDIIARNAMKRIKELEQITALEQKEYNDERKLVS